MPVVIRKEILRYAGLLRPCSVSLSQEKRRLVLVRNYMQSSWFSAQDGHHDPKRECERLALPFFDSKAAAIDVECRCHRFSTEVLHVCRQMHDEGIAVLYGDNRFAFDCRSAASVNILRGLRAESLRRMTALHVFVDYSMWRFFHNDGRESFWPRQKVCGYARTVSELYERTDRFNQCVANWTTMCRILSTAIPSGTVSLDLFCHTIFADAALKVLDPLDRLPGLREIHLRFEGDIQPYMDDYHTPIRERVASPIGPDVIAYGDTEVNAVLASIKLRMTRPAPIKPFRFMDLPTELRLMILAKTDLARSDQWLGLKDNGRCCGKCGGFHKKDSIQCNCHKEGIYKSTCDCPKYPKALLLTSKQMRADALAVLRTNNVVYAVGKTLDEITLGLYRLPIGKLKLIRNLRVCISRPPCREYAPTDVNHCWRSFFGLLQKHFEQDMLVLSFCLHGIRTHYSEADVRVWQWALGCLQRKYSLKRLTFCCATIPKFVPVQVCSKRVPALPPQPLNCCVRTS